MYCDAATLVHTTATAPCAPAQVSFGTACGTGTPDGSEPPRRNCPGTSAQVIGRTGAIAVSDRPAGAEAEPEAETEPDEAEPDEAGAEEEDADDAGADAGADETGGAVDPGAVPAPFEELHPPRAAATTTAATPMGRNVT